MNVLVVVPTYNEKDNLAPLARRVLARPDYRLLVVDDGSSDDSVDLAASWPDARIRVIRSEHTGNPALLRNRAVALARGDYVALHSSTLTTFGSQRSCSCRSMVLRIRASGTAGATPTPFPWTSSGMKSHDPRP